MVLIDFILVPFIATILLTSSILSATEQNVDEQMADVNQNDPAIQRFVEEQSKDFIEEGDQRQPKVDVKLELSKLNFSHVWSQSWPIKSRKLGTVSAVSFDNNGNVVVFHRGDHIYDGSTFTIENIYIPRNKGPIADNTIIGFNRKTGQVAYEWGKNMFYMPHGLTVDHESNIWITDVALHQVLKFNPNNLTNAEMVLGTAFQPGNSLKKFCKPTAVAVLPNGDFFVSDGYCNSRIIKYSCKGDVILSWGHSSFQGISYAHAPRNFFAVPHALTLASDLGLLCVADRENGRVQCFNTINGTFHSQYHSGIIGDRLFSVAYAPLNGGQLYVVNGPQPYQLVNGPQPHQPVMGFVINMQSNKVISKFSPNDSIFGNPHDIIVSPDGNEIYIAQLSPNIVYKFISKNSMTSNKSNSENTVYKQTITLDNKTAITKSTESVTANDVQASRQMLFIVGLLVSFICITLFAVYIITRRQRLDSRNRRRHAWDFPTVKTDGFKLGNLLERKRGFEKLDQEASDEEPNSSTNALLSNAQFA